MSSLPNAPPSADLCAAAPAASTSASVDQRMSELHGLLRELETVAAAGQPFTPVFSPAIDNELAQVRLGTAASLYAVLQFRNAAVAGHALRVALTCSAWAFKMDLPPAARDALEIAALLHDIGMVGVPDQVLLKPGPLTAEETAVVQRSRKASVDILRRSCASSQILEIVESVSAWYDGSRPGFPSSGPRIPLGARMIAIVEAFDAMGTDQPYRSARPPERAMAQLFQCAGSQFDPELVARFAEFREKSPADWRGEVAQRWLRCLDPEMADSHWELSRASTLRTDLAADATFQARLLDNMYDAVVFIDAAGQIALWNHGAERLTGIAGSAVGGQPWCPELLKMSDEKGRAIAEADCPVRTAIICGVQSLRRLTIAGRGGRPVAVDTHAIPVAGENGATRGAILLFHDASSETSLEHRCQNLHDKATKDPLTQVANRAEFDRVHALFIAAHQQQQLPCSLAICDLDRFKTVNDTFGHQAGDDAIRSLASLLKRSCRPGDLVARYGGEEFVMLSADCTSAAAARRAEEIRKALAQTPQPRMEGRTVTVSFGVTEVQPGDTPETMLRRADRALLTAKAQGRNCVVQLGVGLTDKPAAIAAKQAGGAPALAGSKEILRQDLVTMMPMKITIEKLRGFVADHQARVIAVDGNTAELEIADRRLSLLRRLTDRPVNFCLHLHFEEERLEAVRREGGKETRDVERMWRTRIRVAVTTRRNRDRRRSDVAERARQVLASFRSYLMASEQEAVDSRGASSRVKPALVPWLTKRKR